MHPLIRDDQPARLPLRGPMDQPTAASTPLAIQQVLDENTQLLLLAEEVMNAKLEGRHAGETTEVKDAVPILERLQRNLIYLALLADQKAAPKSTQPAAPMVQWTSEELDLLRESLRSFGDNLETLSRVVRTKSPEAIQSVLEQWRKKQ